MYMKRERIDKLLVERGLAPTRQKAQALIMAGCVLVDDEPALKVGQQVSPDAAIRVRGEDHPYVGRGGVKLAAAIEEFDVAVEGKYCMDVGASTGGFTDCLLRNGASRVYAIDVGYGQMAPAIAKDERVVVIDRTNIRNLESDAVPDPIDLAVIDVSFISLEIVLPKVVEFLSPGASIVALVKPQFEVGRELVGKGGIVKDASSHELAVSKVRGAGKVLGLACAGVIESPIQGAKGNREFLIYFRKV
jgi:23S rRNA (cytidine1920-2'-O)/16S rRNA (cytidine1409-2'-O)-methyltransferase